MIEKQKFPELVIIQISEEEGKIVKVKTASEYRRFYNGIQTLSPIPESIKKVEEVISDIKKGIKYCVFDSPEDFTFLEVKVVDNRYIRSFRNNDVTDDLDNLPKF